MREAGPEDFKFIVHSWRESLRNSLFQHWTWKQFKRDFAKAFEALQINPHSCFLVACDPQDSDLIFGWACVDKWSGAHIHYVYVKQSFRLQGIARALVEKSFPSVKEFRVTFVTEAAKKIKAVRVGVLFGGFFTGE